MDIYNYEKNIASSFVTLIPIGIMTGTVIFAKINDTKYNKYVFFVAMTLSAVVYLIFVIFTNKLNSNIMTAIFFLIGFLQGPFIPFMIKIFSFFLPKKTFGASLGIINAIPLILSALLQHFTGFILDSLKNNSLLLCSNMISYKVYFCFLFFCLVIVIWASTHIIKILTLVETKQL